MPIIHWFRRDLRLSDNTALSAAARDSGGDVLPVFVLDDRLLRGRDVASARVRFMLDCLRDLDAALSKRGSRLTVRRGIPEVELLALARESGAGAVYFNRDYTPAARKRDAGVSTALQAAGCRVRSFKDLVIFEEDEVLTRDGKPYTVFTPYKRAWLEKRRLEIGDWGLEIRDESCQMSPISHLQSPISILPSAADLGFSAAQQVPPGGEGEAIKLLHEYKVSGRLAAYHELRDIPAAEGTSRLSPHLRFGTLSPRACLNAAFGSALPLTLTLTINPSQKGRGEDAWINELIWREFYTQILHHFPHADTGNFRRQYDRLRWGNGSDQRDQELFAAWREGRTGYPIVDAAMRQLNQTAWMHNRARMIVASFLTKDLLLDWRWGESYFMRTLVDGDPASNNGGWQWAASTGTDAQPYFRIFNPVLQGERFDPRGQYVRRYVPELARLPDEYIHRPWEMPAAMQREIGCIVGADYPAPIVDHATQKAESLRRFKAIRGSPPG